MITATNVRFLSKEPIVGLKIFDGEKLRKRLQITFTSEGNFNMFTNKINQWLGLSVVANYDGPDSQLANSQTATQGVSLSQTQTAPSSEVASGPKIEQYSQVCGSQPLGSQMFGSRLIGSQSAVSDVPTSQVSCSQDKPSQFVPILDLSQQSDTAQTSYQRNYNDLNQFPQSQMRINPQNPPHNLDALSMLLNAATNDTTRSFSQYDTSALSQSTQIWNENPKGTILQYPAVSSNNTFNKNVTTGPELTQSLREIPFNPSSKRKKTHSSRSRKKNGRDGVLEETIARILEEKQAGYLDLNDEDLSLKICRKLKSKSFLALLKRVEKLLD
ncbi:hypothetical protein JCM33374_g3973 [Metschnikowia sp. JCM 33374]|nr:hypothetical protein JCM33374_g3973 [Metschnikowia sp. JCM 33374]